MASQCWFCLEFVASRTGGGAALFLPFSRLAWQPRWERRPVLLLTSWSVRRDLGHSRHGTSDTFLSRFARLSSTSITRAEARLAHTRTPPCVAGRGIQPVSSFCRSSIISAFVGKASIAPNFVQAKAPAAEANFAASLTLSSTAQ